MEAVCSALHPRLLLSYERLTGSSLMLITYSFPPSTLALICVAIIVANQTRLLEQCLEELIEILRNKKFKGVQWKSRVVFFLW